jgi:hypothetical protein
MGVSRLGFVVVPEAFQSAFLFEKKVGENVQ